MVAKKIPGRPSTYVDAKGAITAAALALFATKGFDATSVNDIAKAAKLPKANVLYYFGDKETLWKHCIDEQWHVVDAFFRQTLPHPLPATRQGLEQICEAFMLACCRFPPYVQIPAIEGNINSWRSDYLAEHHVRRHVDVMHGYIMKLMGKGIVASVEPLFLQTLMTGGGQLLIGQAELWASAAGMDTRSEEFARRYAKQVMEVIAPTRF